MKRLAICLLVFCGWAHAEGPPDVIQLHDGTILQGRLTEWRPSSHAIIVLLNGESRSVEWLDIEHASGPTLANASVTLRPPESLGIILPPPLLPRLLVPDPSSELAKRRRRASALIVSAIAPTILGAVYVGAGAGVSDLSTLHDSFVGMGSVALIAGAALGIAGIVLYSKASAQTTLEASPGGMAISGRF